MKMTYAPTLFAEAARSIGYHPFPRRPPISPPTYTNPLGVRMGQCTYCGFCERFGCANYSKASPQTSVLPVLMRKSNFEARTECEVLKVNLDRLRQARHRRDLRRQLGRRMGAARRTRPHLCLRVQQRAHDAALGHRPSLRSEAPREGTVGRNYAYQTTSGLSCSSTTRSSIRSLRRARSARVVDDFNGDNFDHGGLGFVGGAGIDCRPDQRPPDPDPAGAAGTPRWGAQWKQATKKTYLRSFGLRRRKDRATRPTPTISISIRPTKIALAGRCCA